ncbi:alpha/beta hydrolase family protein [Aurantiacibacter aquimixticola]|uniref:S9 family peptidase n=1 Tax=Aurantiacibacter aquimixticola TaxID=1958945 RepID=A0A419RVV3_9SPHN|nr:S9 family peptidase [Aurantiacibacter aquimixticola]RJY09930.1 S9 family peptidase [Aurantiacibacter aquimixticola]
MKMLRPALLASALVLPSTAAFAQAVMTPEDVARIENTGTVAVSGDGEHIAYTRLHYPDVTQGEANGGGRQQLMLAEGPMDATAYLPEDMRVGSIGFTPDSETITFLWTGEDGDRALYGIPVGGGTYRKLGGVADANVTQYGFSPDGSRIYMLVTDALDTQRDEEQEAGFNSVVYEEEQRFNRMFVANAGMEADPAPVQVAVPGYIDSFQIAPSGQWAMITSAPTPLVDDSYTSKRAHILDLASGNITTVETPGKVGDVEISPDSRQLSMIAAVDANDPADTTLHLVDASTGTFRALNAGAAEAAVDAEWMSDGRLASVIHVGAQSRLRFYSDDGDMLREVDPGDLILASVEQGGNRLTVEAHSPEHPNELFLYNNGSFQRWTNHNPWLVNIAMGEQRTYTYTARDGQQIEGVLIEPVGGVPAGGAPLILDVHGGPEAHESNGWVTNYSGPGQVAAGQGYAVFLPNYRGSTGYGTAFSKQHQGNYTDPEFVDLVDAKYALVEEGIADADRVGVTGGSYGGYATGWSSTYYSEEFAAGVMFVGISNQISKVGTGDIPMEMYLVHALEWPWEDWTRWLEISPIYYADRADTPLLIMHGEEDPRVSPTQSVELYRNIKIRRPDTPLRLVTYPGEGHGNALAAARYDYNLRMMRWFDTYLKTGDRDAPLPPARPTLNIQSED